VGIPEDMMIFANTLISVLERCLPCQDKKLIICCDDPRQGLAALHDGPQFEKRGLWIRVLLICSKKFPGSLFFPLLRCGKLPVDALFKLGVDAIPKTLQLFQFLVETDRLGETWAQEFLYCALLSYPGDSGELWKCDRELFEKALDKVDFHSQYKSYTLGQVLLATFLSSQEDYRKSLHKTLIVERLLHFKLCYDWDSLLKVQRSLFIWGPLNILQWHIFQTWRASCMFLFWSQPSFSFCKVLRFKTFNQIKLF
jgi:hypothetical protein